MHLPAAFAPCWIAWGAESGQSWNKPAYLYYTQHAIRMRCKYNGERFHHSLGGGIPGMSRLP